MLKRLLAALILCSALAFGQGGSTPLPSLIWTNFNLTLNSQASPRYQVSPYPAYSSGTILAFYSNVTGSPTGCGWSVVFGVQNQTGFTGVTNFTYSVSSISNGVAAYRVGPSVIPFNAYSTIGTYWTCSTYPSSGTAQVEFIPDITWGPPLYAGTHITTNTNTQIRGTAATLHGISINAAGSSETITIVDTTASNCTGGVTLAISTGFTTGQFLTFDVTTANGLCITTAGTTAGDYTVTYR